MISNEPSTARTELQTQQLNTRRGVTAYFSLVPAEHQGTDHERGR